MNPSTALRTGGRLLWERSTSVIPLYLLASGLYGVARVPLLVAVLLAVWYLAAAGRLEPFVDALRGLGDGSAPTAPDATDVDQVTPELSEAIVGLLTPETITLLAAGGFLALVLGALASAIGNAAAVSGLYGLLRDEDGVRAGVDGARRYWRSILGVRLLLLAVLGVVALPLVGFFAAVGGYLTTAVASASTTGTPPSWAALGSGVLALLFGVLVAVLLLAAVFVLFAFAEQAVVVDDVGAVEAVRRSVRFPFHRPWDALGYVAVAFGALVVSGSVGSSAVAFGAPRVTALVGAILLPPVVDGFKTALYADLELPETELSRPEERLRAAFWGGIRTVGGFVRAHPLANLASLGLVAIGGIAGWRATSSIGPPIPIGGDVGSVFGSFPLGTFFNLAVNNWLVAADLAYSGLAIGIPAAVGLAFNGLVVGAVGGVFDPVAFVALVAPHGIVEIPAIVVGGALGLWLGGVALGVLRGRRDGDDVAAAIRRTYRVLLGLVPLFVFAAFVEAFLTPAIASLVLGG
ncbi:stage II sporulation protein M [Halobellus rarus]|uniref:Stage II sporulation protein M n=1 Tax=Halobellus rarus TaxID=1126237 RepID=A0ABD6CLD5_9EURY